MIYSAGVVNIPSPVSRGAWLRQLLWFALAIGAYSAVVRISLRWLQWAAWPSYILALLLLAATLVVGTGRGTAEGVRSWISVGALNFQTAELAKIAVVLALARLLGRWKDPPADLSDLLAPAALVGLPLGLILLQPDLGTSLAFVGVLFAMLYWAGTPLPFLALLASPGIGLFLTFDTLLWSGYMVALALSLHLLRYRLRLVEAAGVIFANLAAGTIAQPLWNSLAQHQRDRLLVFLDPTIDPQGAAWHLIQSKVAVGSGGLTGKGFTLGSQKRLNFLPEQHTDFIFSVVGEELGFLGAILAIGAFGYLLHRLIKLAEGSSDPFAGLIIFGIFGAWIVHIFVNIGMTVGLVPVTGIPLPFVSYGGSFLLMSWVGVAIVARAAKKE